LPWDQFGYWCGSALLFPGPAIGAHGLSQIAHAGIDQRRLRIFVPGFAVVSGVVLMVDRQFTIRNRMSLDCSKNQAQT
jgi:hypothetical protein